MTEDNFEDFLKKAAQSYNVPPVRTPRDEMWSAIQAKRAAGPRVVYGGGSVRQPSERRFGSRIWLGAAAAAVLLLATGVGLGRWSATNEGPGTVATTNPPTANPRSAFPATGGSIEAGTTSNVASTQSPNEQSNARPRAIAPGNAGSQSEELRVANGTRGASAPTSPGSASSSAYQLTAVRHLSEAEALLTSFRTRTTADQQMDAQLGSWARELLSNTRLLLDSPVANDPQRRPLLEDLELVLVQIVQLSPGSTPQDRELIEKTLQHDHVMTRLRTAIPAGPQRGS
ncbi:MAG TPA: hypothetical protein VGO33_06165 [Gemmatimonadaceae bacterium]|jgi:hypothetical protein|nr:hypothetical protein [Gemmatimonadaceae bacterium]